MKAHFSDSLSQTLCRLTDSESDSLGQLDSTLYWVDSVSKVTVNQTRTDLVIVSKLVSTHHDVLNGDCEVQHSCRDPLVSVSVFITTLDGFP